MYLWIGWAQEVVILWKCATEDLRLAACQIQFIFRQAIALEAAQETTEAASHPMNRFMGYACKKVKTVLITPTAFKGNVIYVSGHLLVSVKKSLFRH
jgi:hypothetical protein